MASNWISWALLLALSGSASLWLRPWMHHPNPILAFASIFAAFLVGMVCILKTAPSIGLAAQALKGRTRLAPGLLQAVGTAVPDMVIGVLAAILSLKVLQSDPAKSIHLAMIAGSTTLASNIYNIAYAAWCLWRQNTADRLGRHVLMIPGWKNTGVLTPMSVKHRKPSKAEIDAGISLLTALSVVTALCALSLVIAGKNTGASVELSVDIYRLGRWPAVIILVLCAYLLFAFRKAHGPSLSQTDSERVKIANWKVWLSLLAGGCVLVFSAQAVIAAILESATRASIPVTVAGSVAALIGCLGEMAVIHDFSVHPHGNVMDAVTGVAMDNFVTLIGACSIALLGGIYLGGAEAILIFVCILMANTLLIFQTSRLGNIHTHRD